MKLSTSGAFAAGLVLSHLPHAASWVVWASSGTNCANWSEIGRGHGESTCLNAGEVNAVVLFESGNNCELHVHPDNPNKCDSPHSTAGPNTCGRLLPSLGWGSNAKWVRVVCNNPPGQMMIDDDPTPGATPTATAQPAAP